MILQMGQGGGFDVGCGDSWWDMVGYRIVRMVENFFSPEAGEMQIF